MNFSKSRRALDGRIACAFIAALRAWR